MTRCKLCTRIELLKTRQDKNFVHEFKNSYLILGDHQYFPGYCVLSLKNHVRELHELNSDLQTETFQELMQAGKAINQAFKPWKMNYACYGNAVEHIHWHLFPRYESDPDHRTHPWLNSKKFDHQIGSEEERIKRIQLIQNFL